MKKAIRIMYMTFGIFIISSIYMATNAYAISRDPGYSQDPRVIMAQNSARQHRFMRQTYRSVLRSSGYVNGMSAYGAYFAEDFSLDPMGLEKIKMEVYTDDFMDVTFRERLKEGFPTKVENTSALLKLAKEKVGDKYDKTGKCGNCIETITLIAHSGTGWIVLGKGEGISSGKISGPMDKPAKEQKKIEAQIEKNLKDLGALLCEDGKFIVRQCCAAKGEGGKKSIKKLAKLLGATVEGYTGDVEVGSSTPPNISSDSDGNITGGGSSPSSGKSKLPPSKSGGKVK